MDIIALILALSNEGGTGGTSDYLELINKPRINGKEITGNMNSSDLGLQPSGDYATREELNSIVGDINTVLATLTTVSEVS